MWRRGLGLFFGKYWVHGQFWQTAPPSPWWVINSSSVSVNVNEFIFYQQRELRRVIGRWEEGLRTFMYLPPKLGFGSFTLSLELIRLYVYMKASLLLSFFTVVAVDNLFWFAQDSEEQSNYLILIGFISPYRVWRFAVSNPIDHLWKKFRKNLRNSP